MSMTNETIPARFPGCQLASEFKEWPKKDGKPVEQMALEPKFDGYRLSAVVGGAQDPVRFYCRDAKEVGWAGNLKHVADELIAMGFENCMVDGEVMAEDWNKTGMVRSKPKSSVETRLIEEQIKFHAFDLVDLSKLATQQGSRSTHTADPTPMEDRRAQLAAKFVGVNSFSVKLAPMFIVESAEELLTVTKKLIAEGYEGGMAKRLDAPYVCDRTKAWMKLKPTKTVDMTITGSVEGGGKYKGMLGAWTCVDDGGTEVSVGVGFVDAQRAKFWQEREKMVGRRVEVKMQDCDVATARHPVWTKRFRDAEHELAK